jgi:hypothetical protein
MPAGDTARDVAIVQLRQFARSVNAVHRLRRDFALQTPELIKGWRLGRDLTFDEFLGNADTKDDARILLGAVNRAPLRRDLAAARADDQLLEYQVGGAAAEALGLADLYDGLAFSFDQAPWQATSVTVQRSGLVETDAGDVEFVEADINVRNAAAPEHVAQHRPWLDHAGKPRFEDFADFEANRADRLANIDFLSNALDQLRGINPDHPRWNAICTRLDELQSAVVEWDPAAAPAPIWRTKVTGEGETRRRLCDFKDLDGVTRCFDEHARFTPGMGRVHFRIDATNRRLIVAHIGDKL